MKARATRERVGASANGRGPAQTGYSRLRDLIRADIVEGHLAPGARLKIDELAARYTTSAIPVREALQQLQGEGIVRFVANRGASVRAIDRDLVRDIHELRALVEPFLVRRFARQRTAEELDALVAIQRRYDELVERGDLTRTHETNRAFHGLCYDGHYNEEALLIAYRHNDLICALSDRFPKSLDRARDAIREHWGIVDAIRRRDEDEAARITMEHVRKAGQHLIEKMAAGQQRFESRSATIDRDLRTTGTPPGLSVEGLAHE